MTDDVGEATERGGLPPDAFRLIVDQTAHPFVVIALDGSIRYASASVTTLIGWRAEDLVGRNMAEFLVPDDLERAAEAIAEIEGFDRSGAGVPMVFSLVRADGGTTRLEIGAMPLLEEPGVEAIALRLRPYDAQQGLDDFITELIGDEPLDEVLRSLTRSIAESLGAIGAVVHHGFDGTAFESAAGVGVPIAVLPGDRGPWCDAVRNGEPTHRAVALLDPEVAEAAGGLRSCWTVPVPVARGVAPAALSVWRSVAGPPFIGHRLQLERAARYVQLALVRTAEHRRLQHLAGHDALTGAANRAQFRARLAEAIAIGESDLAVAFCDLDGFKPVNDTFGHIAGDAVLVEVADRLRRNLRTGDELARVGGDEFTVLLRNVRDGADAVEVAERLHGAFRDPFVAGTGEVKLSVSIGVAMLTPATPAEALLARADEALYAVKRAGGNGTELA